ncbi:MAG: ATP-binding protein [Mangrovibacterium sp.]|nr:ATP-binding protein [Mangrovibacterium sp.]
MRRSAYHQLKEWKASVKRKPLIVQGARQVGKTYLISEFGKKEYSNFVYLNFERDKSLESLFEKSLDPDIIINNISLYIGEKIVAEDTLLFFDEIQTVPAVLTSLKYFYEQVPDYHLIAAGSLLGVSVGKERSFPVGKVNFLTLYPMSFSEYLAASGEDLLAKKLNEITSPESLPEILHAKLLDLLKMYLYLGGMPEVIQDYIDNKNIGSVRVIQNEILKAYVRDFSKYADKSQAIRTAEFWNSIPGQLAKENKKFKYADIRKGARSAMFEQTIEWLRGAGLINVVYNLTTPKKPLSAYADYSKFKVYMHDVGLLAAMLNITSDLIVSPDRLFTEFNGAFIENFVAQELLYYGQSKQFYWTSGADAEVDFVVESKKNIYPVEVKSGTSRTLKSLRGYADKYRPEAIFRVSPRNLVQSGDFMNVPLYAVNVLVNFIKQ